MWKMPLVLHTSKMSLPHPQEKGSTMLISCLIPVSYTHLDVYKRQLYDSWYLPLIDAEEPMPDSIG